MIELTVSCSKCGRVYACHLSIVKAEDLDVWNVDANLTQRGWIVQVNGDNLDTYCSKECAA